MSAMFNTPAGERHPEIPTALYLIWGALTDEIDASGRGSPEQDASAVRHMKQAAADWLRVMDLPEDRSAYLDRWIDDECGYERRDQQGRLAAGTVPVPVISAAPQRVHTRVGTSEHTSQPARHFQ